MLNKIISKILLPLSVIIILLLCIYYLFKPYTTIEADNPQSSLYKNDESALDTAVSFYDLDIILEDLSSKPNKKNEHSSNIIIKFTYDRLISGYEVKGEFKADEDLSVHGKVKLDFYKEGRLKFSYTNNYYSNYDICKAIEDYHSKEFYPDTLVWKVKYVGPKYGTNYSIKHPLGYYTPFQFYDINFDGKEELIVNNSYGISGSHTSNNYSVYKIIDNSIELISFPPFNQINEYTIIDDRNKQIITMESYGLWEHIYVYYKKSNYFSQIPLHPIDTIYGYGKEFLLNSLSTIDFTIDSVFWHLDYTSKQYDLFYNGKTWDIKSNKTEKELVIKNKTHFYYNQFIDGYEVRGYFSSYDNKGSTDYINIDFYMDGELKFSYKNEEYYSDYNLVKVVNNNGFKGWKSKKEWIFAYPTPDFDNTYYDSLHPLGYHTPFQFLDIDFDGKSEFIVNDYNRAQGGNGYKAYKIKGNKLELLISPPFENICNQTEIDFINKKIVTKKCSGDSNDITIYYKKSNEPSRISMDILDLMENKSLWGIDYLFNSDYAIENNLTIDSVHWHTDNYNYDYNGNGWKRSKVK